MSKRKTVSENETLRRHITALPLRATGHLNQHSKPWQMIQTQNDTVFPWNKPKTTETNENYKRDFFAPKHHTNSHLAGPLPPRNVGCGWGLQTWKVAAADKGWSYSLWFDGGRGQELFAVKPQHLTKCYTGPRTWMASGSGQRPLVGGLPDPYPGELCYSG
jgi:hypothetical protein